jgi:3D (Asp-Asp-Asp) domain-containing protein
MKKAIYLIMAITTFNLISTMIIYQRSDERITKLENIVKEQNSFKVTATMYNAEVSQCDKDPLTTAGMYKINPNKASEHNWIAVSRDLLKRWGGQFDYGDKVCIKGAGHKDGVYTIVDTMNKRFSSKIDFLETKGTKLYKYDNVLLAKL